MHRLPQVLAVPLATVLVGLLPRTALAQAPAPSACSCAPVEQELAAARSATERARHDAEEATSRATTCSDALDSKANEAQKHADEAAQCEQRRAQICSASGALVDGFARGATGGAEIPGCVSADQRARVDALLGGLGATQSSLGQLGAYLAGETNAMPRPRRGNTPLERTLSQLLRSGDRSAFHRRLLVEALELIAPKSLARIRTGGVPALDAWFSSREPLRPDLIAEVQRTDDTKHDPSAPPLTAALHLVQAFEIAAGCVTNAPKEGECVRAHQLRQLLESSGTLVVRRRIQEIWATECGSISPEVVSTWVAEFPIANLNSGKANPWIEIGGAAYVKLFGCYLDNESEHRPLGTWLKEMLPAATSLSAEPLRRVDRIAAHFHEGSPEEACAGAVRAMQNLAIPPTCAVPVGEFRGALTELVKSKAIPGGDSIPLGVCTQYAQLLWEGKAARIESAFSRPPSIDEMVMAKPAEPTPMWRLRNHCDERRGEVGRFESDIAVLASFDRAFGDGVERPPFRVDPMTLRPIELVRFEAARSTQAFVSHVIHGTSPCTALGLAGERCHMCEDLAPDAAYDCGLVARLETVWGNRLRALLFGLGGLVAAIVGISWARRMASARPLVRWARETIAHFERIDLRCRPNRFRWAFPSRHDSLLVTLPSDPAWERWGKTAAIVRAPLGPRVRESDVNHAAFVARRAGASVALLEHDDAAAPDLSAIRAMLEWAAKGGARAVQILPISVSRSRWSNSARDVLDLVEESSLRGNPFDVRGRISTSTQFFNRERLVSGLLAAAQAGHWMVITGLRRFGKSSLTLEVARRLPGPAAYVDLSGFDHEIAQSADPSSAASSIVRFVCFQLYESARSRWPNAGLPNLPTDPASLDAAGLTHWLREFSRACREASGQETPVLVILDEIEQVLATGPANLKRALDVLAVVVGRLKSAVGDAAMPQGGAPTMGVFLSSALHSLLWAPLRTLANQSLMGRFQRVCVPCLADDSATFMMRSLGGRQGIRFTDEAIARIVRESQGIPLLLRRLGASVLELYDAERARQGSLGAVEVGIEGVNEAIARETREGSPLRVWIETEIAGPRSVIGTLLRKLASEDSVSTAELRALAKRRIEGEFERTGMSAALPTEEISRRVEEAADVMVQMLDECGLVIPIGDLTAPEAYSLPDAAIRRILRVKPYEANLASATPLPG